MHEDDGTSPRRKFLVTPELDEFPAEKAPPVDEAGPEDDSDRALAAELTAWLELEVDIDLRRIHLRVRNGEVHIQGSVDSKEIRKSLEQLLAERPGVTNVESYLQVVEDMRD